MNYHELKYILCIAKYQNLTKAAQELYISQPTLTKHLQKLEREMGTKLFSRSGNSYTPTFAGRNICSMPERSCRYDRTGKKS